MLIEVNRPFLCSERLARLFEKGVTGIDELLGVV